MKRCPSYCGLTCVNGSCPKALYEDNPEYFDERPSCKSCSGYNGCEDCCVAYYSGITEEQCRAEHGLKEDKHENDH